MKEDRLFVAMAGLRSPWGTEGGVEAHVAALAPRLVKRGAHVTVDCRERYNPHGNCYREGVRLADVPTVYSRSAEAFVHTALTAPRACLRHDIVHLHACGPALFAPVPRGLGRRAVVTLHGRDWERDKWGPAARAVLRGSARVGMRTADAVIGVSNELAPWCRDAGARELAVIPNGVEPHEPVACDPAIFPMLRPGAYFLFLGRLVPEKGLGTLVAAAAAARLQLPVVITGGGTYTAGFVSKLRREAPEERVIFTGPRFGLEKRMLLSHARAFVFPSRLEGLPVALLEAMAAGLPLLASDNLPNVEAHGGLARAGRSPPPTMSRRALPPVSPVSVPQSPASQRGSGTVQAERKAIRAGIRKGRLLRTSCTTPTAPQNAEDPVAPRQPGLRVLPNPLRIRPGRCGSCR